MPFPAAIDEKISIRSVSGAFDYIHELFPIIWHNFSGLIMGDGAIERTFIQHEVMCAPYQCNAFSSSMI